MGWLTPSRQVRAVETPGDARGVNGNDRAAARGRLAREAIGDPSIAQHVLEDDAAGRARLTFRGERATLNALSAILVDCVYFTHVQPFPAFISSCIPFKRASKVSKVFL